MTMASPSVLHIDTGTLLRGGQRQLLLLSEHLQRLGINQAIASPKASELSRRTIHLPVTPVSPYSLLRIFRLGPLKEAVAAYGINIIHAHDSHAHTLGLRLKRACPGLKLVVTRRVAFLPSSPLSRRFKYRRAVDRYIAISRAVAAVLTGAGVPGERISVIPSALDIDQIFRAEADPGFIARMFPGCAKVIVSIGSLTPEKNMATAVRAYSLVVKRLPDVGMIVLGEGPQRGALEDVKLRLHLDNLVLAGHREPVAPILKACDLFLLCSTSEGLNTSAIEAAACGLPLVVSNVGGLPEIAEEGYNGILCPPGRAERFAGAVVELLTDDARRREMSARGVKKAETFDIHAAAEKTLAVYNSLLAG